jgi:hypothetical protein
VELSWSGRAWVMGLTSRKPMPNSGNTAGDLVLRISSLAVEVS